MKIKHSEKIDEALSKLCNAIARQSVREITKHLNDLPMPNEIKTSAIFTIEIAMLNATVNGLYRELGPDALLERKLELLRIIEENWRKEKELRDDAG